MIILSVHFKIILFSHLLFKFKYKIINIFYRIMYSIDIIKSTIKLFYELKKDYELMEKYYLMAIELNNFNAMDNLGTYYYKVV